MGLHDRILVATDLTARSDRALDRAIMLAGRDASKLCIVHVVEGRTRSVRAQLVHDLGEAADRATIRIEHGNPAEVIRDIAREMSSTLIVVGVTRTERLGRVTLGATVERLMRTADQPLLLVTERPRGPYEKAGVAIDFTRFSAETVALAAGLFPHQPIAVLHASEPLATYGAADVKAHREAFRQAKESGYAHWLANAGLPLETRQRIHPQVLQGEPPKALREAAEAGAFDLVVLATHGHRRIFEFFLGSVAKRILAELPCDALFIRESQLPAAAAAVAGDLVSAR